MVRLEDKHQNSKHPNSFTNSLKIITGDIIKTLIFSLLLFLFINSISERVVVESISMQPTLYAGDFVLINKTAYQFNSPERGDVIIFHSPVIPSKQPYIKRIIGIPGDRIRITGGEVFVNHNRLRENYLKSKPNYEGEWLVPQSMYFVLGDNRNRSSDSHSWGMVPASDIIGKAILIYFPASHWRTFYQMNVFAAEP